MTSKRIVALIGICFLLMALTYLVGGGEILTRQVIHPLQFHVRNDFGYGPKFNSRIKIYAVDHKTMSYVGLENIPIDDWIVLFHALADANVSAVLVDKTFPLPLSKDESKIRQLREAIRKTAPVTAGAFFVEKPMAGFSEIETRSLGFNFQALEQLPVLSGHVYGPTSDLIRAFSSVGHTNYEDHGFIKPIIRTRDDSAIAFWGLDAAGPINEVNGELHINNHHVPVNSDGDTLVNLAAAEDYWSRTRSLVGLLKRARSNQKLNELNKGDVVLIFADMVQGTSFRNTPAGTMPGAFIMSAVVNSAFENNWIRPIGGELIYLLFAGILGAIVALCLRPIAFILAISSITFCVVGAPIYFFCTEGVDIPWGLSLVAFWMNAGVLFTEKARHSDERSKHLHFSLAGMIGPKKLERVLKNPQHLQLKPNCQVLTIMFIDIVGFSVNAKDQNPEVMFQQLRDHLSHIADVVHECGGIVDKSLGDGMLCYFGYQFEHGDTENSAHAEQATDCAIRIQKEALVRNLAASVKGSPVFPLRIGINTGEVFVGDMGGSKKIEFTVIGHTVNIAQRLETACEIYRILCGSSTFEQLKGRTELVAESTRRLIPIKHQEGHAEVFEINPFSDRPDLIADALKRYRKTYGARTEETRVMIKSDQPVYVNTKLGTGLILDRSLSGFAVEMDEVIGCGTILEFTFNSSDGVFEKLCREHGVHKITGEVRWARLVNNSYRYGIQLKDLSVDDRRKLLEAFASVDRSNDSSNRRAA